MLGVEEPLEQQELLEQLGQQHLRGQLDTEEIQWKGWHKLRRTMGCLGTSVMEQDLDKKSECCQHSTIVLLYHLKQKIIIIKNDLMTIALCHSYQLFCSYPEPLLWHL